MASIIKRIIDRRRRDKAFKKGAEARKSGQVGVPTTGGFVNVPIGSDVAKRSAGSGSSAGGGSSRGGGFSSNEKARLDAERALSEKVAQQKIADEKARQEALSSQQKADLERRRIADITQRNKQRELDIQRQQKEFGIKLASFKTDIDRRDFLIEQKKLSRAFDIQRATGGAGQVATQKQANEIQNSLASGDSLIYNPNTMTITGIKSATLGKTIPWTNKGIAFYNSQIGKLGGLANVQGQSVKKDVKVSASDIILVKGLLGVPNFNLWQKETINKVENWQPDSQFGRNIKATAGGIKTFSTDLFIHLPVALIKLLFGLGTKIGDFGLEKARNPRQTLEQLRLARKTAFDYVKRKGIKVLRESDKVTAENIFRLYLKNLQNQKILNKSQVSFALKNYAKYINFNKLAVRKDVKKAVLEKAGSESFVRDVRAGGRVALNTFVITTATDVVNIPAGLVSIVNDPRSIKKIPKAMVIGAKDNLTLLKTSPAAGIGKIGSNIFVFVMIGKTMKFTGKFTGRAAIKLNPFLKRFENGTLRVNIPAEIFMRGGRKINLRKRITKTTIINRLLGKAKKALPKDSKIFKRIKVRKKGQFRKFQKSSGFTLTKGGVREAQSSIASQLAREGTRQKLVSAQSRAVFKWWKRTHRERKHIPGEENFDKVTKKLLKRFDRGKLTEKEFNELNIRIRKQTISEGQPAGVDLLERSMYFGLDEVLRVSRFGFNTAGEGTFFDLLRGKASLFKKNYKPQMLLLDDVLDRLPRTKANASLRRKLESSITLGKTANLTTGELNKLTKFAVRQSGKPKGVGSTTFGGGIEGEATISPFDKLRKIKKVGTALIEEKGQQFRVPIYLVKILQSKKKLGLINITNKIMKEILRLKNILRKTKSKAARKRIQIKIKKLETTLKRDTKKISDIELKAFLKLKRGRRRIRRRDFDNRKVFPTGRKAGQIVSRVSRRSIERKSKGRTPTARRKTTAKRTGGRSTSKRPTARGRTTGKRTPSKRMPVKRTGGSRTNGGRTGGGRTSTREKKTPIRLPLPKKFKKRTISKKVPVFLVRERIKGRVVTLTPKPLTLNDAMDFAAFRIDTRLSRTSFFEPFGKSKRVISLPKNIKNYFKNNSRKFRRFKIRVGVKKQLRHGIIERKAFIGDTASELRQLKRARQKAKRIVRKIKRKVIRRVKRRVVIKPRLRKIKQKRKTTRTTKKKTIKTRKPTKKRTMKRKSTRKKVIRKRKK